MGIKELRGISGLSQSRFAESFDIPLSTLKDWEQGRRTPPQYVINMIKTILEYRGIDVNGKYIIDYERRKESVERALAILMSASAAPDENFMEVLNEYIDGRITLKDIERKVDRLEFLGA